MLQLGIKNPNSFGSTFHKVKIYEIIFLKPYHLHTTTYTSIGHHICSYTIYANYTLYHVTLKTFIFTFTNITNMYIALVIYAINSTYKRFRV